MTWTRERLEERTKQLLRTAMLDCPHHADTISKIIAAHAKREPFVWHLLSSKALWAMWRDLNRLLLFREPFAPPVPLDEYPAVVAS